MAKQALLVKTKTQPAKRAEVLQLFQHHLAARTAANEAQELVIWCADDQDADTFYLFEIYRSREAFQANAQAAFQAGWFQAYMQAVQPLLLEQPTVTPATPAWAKGIEL
jgi:quinol monooxygenase YgiN